MMRDGTRSVPYTLTVYAKRLAGSRLSLTRGCENANAAARKILGGQQSAIRPRQVGLSEAGCDWLRRRQLMALSPSRACIFPGSALLNLYISRQQRAALTFPGNLCENLYISGQGISPCIFPGKPVLTLYISGIISSFPRTGAGVVLNQQKYSVP